MPADFTAAKAPPRKSATGTTRKPAAPQPVPKSLTEVRNEGLQGLGQIGQALLSMAGQYADAGAIGMHYPPFAAEVANLADSYDSVGKVVDIVIQIGPFTAILATGLPLVMQILANHRIVDPNRMIGGNIMDPQTLEAQMKSNILRMQTEAMRQQHAARQQFEAELREFQRLEAEMTKNDSTSVPV